jgi:peptide chain release factor 1
MKGVILELRAGTGGEEAALFVADLFRMYRTYALRKGLSVIVLDAAASAHGGFRSLVCEIDGESAYDLFRYEGGVHRVQRIPKTERSGRVHTSTVTVAVLKKAEPKEYAINPQDISVEFFRSSGPGGQNVNKRETAVRITHAPTGVVVTSQTERDQGANREFALSLLRSRLLEHSRAVEGASAQSSRKEQIGSAERAEKIRTYNFPQNRLTDHRVGKSWHNLDDILEGELDKVFSAASQGIK